jgi:hypothetical protein
MLPTQHPDLGLKFEMHENYSCTLMIFESDILTRLSIQTREEKNIYYSY